MLINEMEKQKILQSLSYGEFCNNNLTNEDDCEDYQEYMNFYTGIYEQFANHYDKTCEVDHGASKIAIIIPSLDIVVKIPFVGDYDGYYCGAKTDLDCDNWNYCQAEYEKFLLAKEAGLEECFAKIEKIGDIFGHPIYIQEIADIHDKDYDISHSNHTEEDEKDAAEYCSFKEKYLNQTWAGEAIAYYGKDFFQKIVDFISDNRISDLSTSNIGYIKGRHVLVDYSNFNS